MAVMNSFSNLIDYKSDYMNKFSSLLLKLQKLNSLYKQEVEYLPSYCLQNSKRKEMMTDQVIISSSLCELNQYLNRIRHIPFFLFKTRKEIVSDTEELFGEAGWAMLVEACDTFEHHYGIVA